MLINEELAKNKARWVAQKYKSFKEEKGDSSEKEIYEQIIRAYFSGKNKPFSESEMLNHYVKGLKGLRAVTLLILDEEQEIMKESDKNVESYLQQIENTLKGEGLNDDIIYDN